MIDDISVRREYFRKYYQSNKEKYLKKREEKKTKIGRPKKTKPIYQYIIRPTTIYFD